MAVRRVPIVACCLCLLSVSCCSMVVEWRSFFIFLCFLLFVVVRFFVLFSSLFCFSFLFLWFFCCLFLFVVRMCLLFVVVDVRV